MRRFWSYFCRVVSCVVLSLAAVQPVQAQSAQRDMAAALEAAGYHEHEDRRHEVSVDDCIMTTYVYEDWDEHEKVLWSSFRFDMRFVKPMAKQRDGRHFIWVPMIAGQSTTIILFEMRPGTFARHEMAMRRKPKPPFQPSPREGVDSYIFKDKTSFFISQVGHEDDTQPGLFVSLFQQYTLDYCATIG